jgi:hypothetical protein|tara:strand:- start:343 stop:489 length:147 start_codon:yes stop_codon:yes gene_type:complete
MIALSDGVAVSRIVPYYIIKEIKTIEEAYWLTETTEVHDYEKNKKHYV